MNKIETKHPDQEALVSKLERWQMSPLSFIYDMWGLKPQPLLPENRHLSEEPAYTYNPVTKENQCIFSQDMFEPFIKGKHITWQQWLFFRSIEWALEGKAPKRIAAESGHGTGKSASLAIVIIWYLICFKKAQIPCTAPTQYQMHDVLWKEVQIWMDKMPEAWSDLLEWSAGYIRVKESPTTWFARARTARKENPEALAGIHGENVAFIIDEATGVVDEVFRTAEGALTGEDVLVIMFSNHTRIIGYFHEAFTTDREAWQLLSFDAEESPIVDERFVNRIEKRHGRDSDEFRIRVSGRAPREDMADDSGYVPLLKQEELRIIQTPPSFTGIPRLGVDPAKEGKNKTAWFIRDPFVGKIVRSEELSQGKTIAQKTIEIATYYGIPASEIDIDIFGVGAEAYHHLGLAGWGVNGWNVGEKSDDEHFFNLRAQGFWTARQLLLNGFELVEHGNGVWKQQALGIRYRRTTNGKIQIMPKVQMLKAGFQSPDEFDAFMLTCLRPDSTMNEGGSEYDEPYEDKEYRHDEIGV